jgi:hypothetical protein
MRDKMINKPDDGPAVGSAGRGGSCRATSSAATFSKHGGALAVFKLMASWNFVGCWVGRSAGSAPRRIRAT